MVKMNIYIRNSSGWELFFSNIHGKYDRFDMNLPKNTPNWKYFFTKENHPNPKTFECSKALDLIRSAGDKRCEDSRDGLWDEWFEASVEEGLESTWRCYRNILSVFGVSDGGEWWWKVFFFGGGRGQEKCLICNCVELDWDFNVVFIYQTTRNKLWIPHSYLLKLRSSDQPQSKI